MIEFNAHHHQTSHGELQERGVHSRINFCDVVEGVSFPEPGQIQLLPVEQLNYDPINYDRFSNHSYLDHSYSRDCRYPGSAPHSAPPEPLSGAALEEQLRVDLLNARSSYGPESMEVAEALFKLGGSCEAQFKGNESENYYRQAAGIAQKFDSNDAGFLLLQLSDKAEKHGKYDEGWRWMDKGWKILDKNYDNNSK